MTTAGAGPAARGSTSSSSLSGVGLTAESTLESVSSAGANYQSFAQLLFLFEDERNVASRPDYYAKLFNRCKHMEESEESFAEVGAILPRLYAGLLRDIVSPDTKLSNAALRLIGYFLHHPECVKAADMPKTLTTLIQFMSACDDWSRCTLVCWIISEQQIAINHLNDFSDKLVDVIVSTITRCGQSSISLLLEAMDAIKRLNLEIPDAMQRLAHKWVMPIFPLLLFPIDRKAEDVTQKIRDKAESVTVLVPSHLSLAHPDVSTAVCKYLLDGALTRIKEEMKSAAAGSAGAATVHSMIRALSQLILLCGKPLTDSSNKFIAKSNLVNHILAAIQPLFSDERASIRVEAFNRCWRAVITTFALNRSFFIRDKCFTLIIKPFLYRIAKDADAAVRTACAHVWLHAVKQFGADELIASADLFDKICTPVLTPLFKDKDLALRTSVPCDTLTDFLSRPHVSPSLTAPHPIRSAWSNARFDWILSDAFAPQLTRDVTESVVGRAAVQRFWTALCRWTVRRELHSAESDRAAYCKRVISFFCGHIIRPRRSTRPHPNQSAVFRILLDAILLHIPLHEPALTAATTTAFSYPFVPAVNPAAAAIASQQLASSEKQPNDQRTDIKSERFPPAAASAGSAVATSAPLSMALTPTIAFFPSPRVLSPIEYITCHWIQAFADAKDLECFSGGLSHILQRIITTQPTRMAVDTIQHLLDAIAHISAAQSPAIENGTGAGTGTVTGTGTGTGAANTRVSSNVIACAWNAVIERLVALVAPTASASGRSPKSPKSPRTGAGAAMTDDDDTEQTQKIGALPAATSSAAAAAAAGTTDRKEAAKSQAPVSMNDWAPVLVRAVLLPVHWHHQLNTSKRTDLQLLMPASTAPAVAIAAASAAAAGGVVLTPSQLPANVSTPSTSQSFLPPPAATGVGATVTSVAGNRSSPSPSSHVSPNSVRAGAVAVVPAFANWDRLVMAILSAVGTSNSGGDSAELLTRQFLNAANAFGDATSPGGSIAEFHLLNLLLSVCAARWSPAPGDDPAAAAAAAATRRVAKTYKSAVATPPARLPLEIDPRLYALQQLVDRALRAIAHRLSSLSLVISSSLVGGGVVAAIPVSGYPIAVSSCCDALTSYVYRRLSRAGSGSAANPPIEEFTSWLLNTCDGLQRCLQLLADKAFASVLESDSHPMADVTPPSLPPSAAAAAGVLDISTIRSLLLRGSKSIVELWCTATKVLIRINPTYAPGTAASSAVHYHTALLHATSWSHYVALASASVSPLYPTSAVMSDGRSANSSATTATQSAGGGGAAHFLVPPPPPLAASMLLPESSAFGMAVGSSFTTAASPVPAGTAAAAPAVPSFGSVLRVALTHRDTDIQLATIHLWNSTFEKCLTDEQSQKQPSSAAAAAAGVSSSSSSAAASASAARAPPSGGRTLIPAPLLSALHVLRRQNKLRAFSDERSQPQQNAAAFSAALIAANANVSAAVAAPATTALVSSVPSAAAAATPFSPTTSSSAPTQLHTPPITPQRPQTAAAAAAATAATVAVVVPSSGPAASTPVGGSGPIAVLTPSPLPKPTASANTSNSGAARKLKRDEFVFVESPVVNPFAKPAILTERQREMADDKASARRDRSVATYTDVDHSQSQQSAIAGHAASNAVAAAPASQYIDAAFRAASATPPDAAPQPQPQPQPTADAAANEKDRDVMIPVSPNAATAPQPPVSIMPAATAAGGATPTVVPSSLSSPPRSPAPAPALATSIAALTAATPTPAAAITVAATLAPAPPVAAAAAVAVPTSGGGGAGGSNESDASRHVHFGTENNMEISASPYSSFRSDSSDHHPPAAATTAVDVAPAAVKRALSRVPSAVQTEGGQSMEDDADDPFSVPVAAGTTAGAAAPPKPAKRVPPQPNRSATSILKRGDEPIAIAVAAPAVSDSKLSRAPSTAAAAPGSNKRKRDDAAAVACASPKSPKSDPPTPLPAAGANGLNRKRSSSAERAVATAVVVPVAGPIHPELIGCSDSIQSSVLHEFPPSFKQLFSAKRIASISDLASQTATECNALPLGSTAPAGGAAFVRTALERYAKSIKWKPITPPPPPPPPLAGAAAAMVVESKRNDEPAPSVPAAAAATVKLSKRDKEKLKKQKAKEKAESRKQLSQLTAAAAAALSAPASVPTAGAVLSVSQVLDAETQSQMPNAAFIALATSQPSQPSQPSESSEPQMSGPSASSAASASASAARSGGGGAPKRLKLAPALPTPPPVRASLTAASTKQRRTESVAAGSTAASVVEVNDERLMQIETQEQPPAAATSQLSTRSSGGGAAAALSATGGGSDSQVSVQLHSQLVSTGATFAPPPPPPPAPATATAEAPVATTQVVVAMTEGGAVAPVLAASNNLSPPAAANHTALNRSVSPEVASAAATAAAAAVRSAMPPARSSSSSSTVAPPIALSAGASAAASASTGSSSLTPPNPTTASATMPALSRLPSVESPSAVAAVAELRRAIDRLITGSAAAAASGGLNDLRLSTLLEVQGWCADLNTALINQMKRIEVRYDTAPALASSTAATPTTAPPPLPTPATMTVPIRTASVMSSVAGASGGGRNSRAPSVTSIAAAATADERTVSPASNLSRRRAAAATTTGAAAAGLPATTIAVRTRSGSQASSGSSGSGSRRKSKG